MRLSHTCLWILLALLREVRADPLCSFFHVYCKKTLDPTPSPIPEASLFPSPVPTALPSSWPSDSPTSAPSSVPTDLPSSWPSDSPTSAPSLFPSSVPTNSCTVNVNPGTNLLQPAIDAASPGDIICLAAGDHVQSSLVVINKSVQLWGTQRSVDPRPSFGSSRTSVGLDESRIVGDGLTHILSIEADNVILDGLVVTVSSGDMIRSLTGTPVQGVAIRNTIITDSSGDEGIQLRACTGCVVEYNNVFDTAGDGINMCCGSEQGFIRFNEVHKSSSIDGAIYVYDADGIHVTDNLVYESFVNEGIKIGASCSSNFAPNGSVERNVIRDVAQDGINIYSDNTIVVNNEISSSSSSNGALFIQCTGTTGFVVTGNYIHDNTSSGIKVGNLGNLGVGDGIIINNCIEGNNVGVEYTDTFTLNVANNWWDSNTMQILAPSGTVNDMPQLASRPDCGPP